MLSRDENESAEEWIGHLKIKANECSYNWCDRQFKKQFINGTNDEMMWSEIIKELTAIKETNEKTSEQLLKDA